MLIFVAKLVSGNAHHLPQHCEGIVNPSTNKLFVSSTGVNQKRCVRPRAEPLCGLLAALVRYLKSQFCREPSA